MDIRGLEAHDYDIRLPGKPKSTKKAPYGLREDGTPKGKGYLGLIPTSNGRQMSEVSMSFDMGGKEVLIPAIVPTLTKSEIRALQNRKDGEPIPESVVKKALDHARKRREAGLSPFID